MDFMIRLPKTILSHDTIWVIVDILMKSAHFLAMKATDPLDEVARLYIKKVIRLHDIPM